jgi:tetratricopeptide (TPR) repeat protein
MKENLKNKNNLHHKIKFLLLFFFLAAQFFSLYALSADTTTVSGPSISFSEDYWDFGEIAPDELPTHIFKFKNIGDEVLIIEGTKVSCESCIDPVLDMIGRFTKRIYVESNDPVNPRTIITVSGFIRDSQQTPFTIGIYYFSRGEYDKAIIEFEKSIELDASHTESYYYLGQCYLQRGIIEYNNKNIFKAYSLYRKANELSEQVIPKYEKIIADNPEDLTMK